MNLLRQFFILLFSACAIIIIAGSCVPDGSAVKNQTNDVFTGQLHHYGAKFDNQQTNKNEPLIFSNNNIKTGEATNGTGKQL